MIRLAVACVVLLWTVFSVQAASLSLDGRFEQGGMVIGTVPPGSTAAVNGTRVRVSPDGVFVFGFGRDHGPDVGIAVTYPDGGGEKRRLKVAKRQYRIQRIDGLPPKMVTPPPDVLKRIRAENARIAAVRRRDSATTWFADGWIWPARGIVSGVFGSQRVLNGKPRRPHYGIDVAAAKGTPVVAPTDAVVAMAEGDLYYTGGTVMLDHGHGITSVYSHLSRVTVKAGQTVAQGDVIGAVGSTGRSTGPHLDWRINWFKERLDPAFLVPPMPKN